MIPEYVYLPKAYWGRVWHANPNCHYLKSVMHPKRKSGRLVAQVLGLPPCVKCVEFKATTEDRNGQS